MLHTHQIWTTAAVIATPKSVPVLREHMTRSKGLPVHLDFLVHHGNDDFQLTSDFIDATSAQLHSCPKLRTLCIIGYTPLSVVKAVRDCTACSALGAIEKLELDVYGHSVRHLGTNMMERVASGVAQLGALPSLAITGLRAEGSIRRNALRMWTSRLEKLHLKACDASVLHFLCVLDMPALAVLAIDCSASQVSQPGLPLTASVYALPSARFIALYHVPVISDVTRILELAPNATHLALLPSGEWRLEDAIIGHLPHLDTLSVGGQSVSLGDVGAALRLRLQTVRVVEMSSAAIEGASPSEADALKWIQAHTSLRPLHEEELEIERILERWGVYKR